MVSPTLMPLSTEDLVTFISAMASSEVGEKEVQEYGIGRKRLVKEFKYKHIFEFLENNPSFLDSEDQPVASFSNLSSLADNLDKNKGE